MSTVPMFAPDGSLGDIPYERMKDALAAGAKPAVQVQAPDGSKGYIPSERMADAVKAGGKILPFEQQEAQHPGFWHAVVSDLTGLPKAALPGLAGPPGLAYQSIKQGINDLQTARQTGKTSGQLQNESEKSAGYGPGYRYGLAPIAGAVGVNVPGMEQSAAEGDVGGVAGHATAAAAPVVGATVLSAGINAVAPKLQGLADTASKRMYQSALKPSTALPTERVASMVRTGLDNGIPVSAEGAAKLDGLVKDLGDKVKAQIQTGNNQGATIDPQAVAQRADQVKAKFATQVNPTSDLAAIDSAKAEFLQNNPNPIPAADAQAMKQGTYAQLKGRAFGELKSATVEAQKALARGIKEELEQQFPEIKGQNAQQGELRNLDGALERALRRIDNHQLLGVGTPIAAGAGGMLTGTPVGAAAAGIMKMILDNPEVKSKLAIAIARGSKSSGASSAMMRVMGYSAALGKPADTQSQSNP